MVSFLTSAFSLSEYINIHLNLTYLLNNKLVLPFYYEKQCVENILTHISLAILQDRDCSFIHSVASLLMLNTFYKTLPGIKPPGANCHSSLPSQFKGSGQLAQYPRLAEKEIFPPSALFSLFSSVLRSQPPNIMVGSTTVAWGMLMLPLFTCWSSQYCACSHGRRDLPWVPLWPSSGRAFFHQAKIIWNQGDIPTMCKESQNPLPKCLLDHVQNFWIFLLGIVKQKAKITCLFVCLFFYFCTQTQSLWAVQCQEAFRESQWMQHGRVGGAEQNLVPAGQQASSGGGSHHASFLWCVTPRSPGILNSSLMITKVQFSK